MDTRDDGRSGDREGVSIEREKLQLEREKLEVEKQKAKWTAIGLGVPVVALAATVMLGIWTQDRKGRDDFALKAAEILMAGDSPVATHNKAKALSVLFPSRLPRDFAKSFDPDAFGRSEPDTLASKRDLVTLMAAHPPEAERILAIWKAMFPGDAWLPEVEANLRSSAAFQRAAPGRR